MDLFGAVRHEKIKVVRNGVDLRVLSRRSAGPAPLPAPKTARLTAICGRMTANKGIDVYLRAMQRLKDSHPDLHHLVIGEGSEALTRELIELADGLGLGERVWFLGHRHDAIALFRVVDVVVSASARESFGRTLIEAMACGVPVVATRSGGPEEIVTDGKNGFLVNIGDDAAIAGRVAELLDNHVLAEALGSAGRALVREKFTLECTVAGVAESFEQALAAARAIA
jgi:glycosyltransferase involved in cell wall biosynthesis